MHANIQSLITKVVWPATFILHDFNISICLVSELNATAMCFPPCENGKCVLEGFCLCDRGWTGATCSTCKC